MVDVMLQERQQVTVQPTAGEVVAEASKAVEAPVAEQEAELAVVGQQVLVRQERVHVKVKPIILS